MDNLIVISGDTKEDVVLSGMDWEDAHVLADIPVGTAMIIQNKTTDFIYVFVKNTKPSSAVNGGIKLAVGQSAQIAASQSGCWLSGFGSVNIRVSV